MSGVVLQDNGERLSSFLQKESTQQYISGVLGDKKNSFVTNMMSLVSQNPSLTKCTNISLMSGAIIATSLNLSLNKSFGYAYLVPFDVKEYDKVTKERVTIRTEAQFQIGYKGYIQLAMRTGQYRRLNAVAICKSQFKGWNALTEELDISDLEEKDGDEIVGYVAYFKLINGFEKTMYWSHEKMMAHADKYSQAFSAKKYEDLQNNKIPDDELWKYSSFWYKDFPAMALKTMLRQLLNKYGILSEEMETAYQADNAIMHENKPIYIENIDGGNSRSAPNEPTKQPDPLAAPTTVDIEDI